MQFIRMHASLNDQGRRLESRGNARRVPPSRSNANSEAEESDTDDWPIPSVSPGMDNGTHTVAGYRDGSTHIGSTVTGRAVTADGYVTACRYMAVTADRYFTMPWGCFGGGWDRGEGECRGQCKGAQEMFHMAEGVGC